MNSKTTTSIKWRYNSSRGPLAYYSDQDPFHLWVDFEVFPDRTDWLAILYKVTDNYECVKIFSGRYKSKAEAMIAAFREWEARR